MRQNRYFTAYQIKCYEETDTVAFTIAIYQKRAKNYPQTEVVKMELLFKCMLLDCCSKTVCFQLEWAIQRINFLSGATNTGLALKLALERGFDGARGGDVPRVAVVVTDGQSQVSFRMKFSLK